VWQGGHSVQKLRFGIDEKRVLSLGSVNIFYNQRKTAYVLYEGELGFHRRPIDDYCIGKRKTMKRKIHEIRYFGSSFFNVGMGDIEIFEIEMNDIREISGKPIGRESYKRKPFYVFSFVKDGDLRISYDIGDMLEFSFDKIYGKRKTLDDLASGFESRKA
jgi:hypothetical protein